MSIIEPHPIETIQEDEPASPVNPNPPRLNAEMESIRDIFGEAYTPYVTNTEMGVVDYMKRFERGDTPPPSVHPWECRIGLSRFLVPPTNISVSQEFRAGSIGGSLRQQGSPKFNSGHSETVINMTLYFPNHEAVWGFKGEKITIDFEKDPDSVIDSFASSLRGLIAQFRYAPFLPIKNDYINRTYDVTGVALQNLEVYTVPQFPFCLVAQVTLLKFNHKVYLPMLSDFDQAIHWGRFRQYVGRAAERLSEVATKGFLTSIEPSDYEALIAQQEEDSLISRFRDLLPEYFRKKKLTEFNKLREWEDGRHFEIYYPDHTPVNIIHPDISTFRNPQDDNIRKRRNWWQTAIGALGFPYAPDSEASYESVDRYWGQSTQYLYDEKRLLSEFLRAGNIAYTQMGPAILDQYLEQRTEEYNQTNGGESSINNTAEFQRKLRASWFVTIYESLIQDPYLANVFEYQELTRDFLVIKEWEVPMRRLNLDPENVLVQSVAVGLSNNYARIQLQLQDEPIHQHMGGGDTLATIGLIVKGEEDLAKLRILWDHINGLARLEHGHGVLGFVGIKNVVTALCGMKYAMPQSWQVNAIEGFPHWYEVTLTFTDFDVFQQKREILSSDQQAELIEAFTKRNPFLRIKQRWSAFSAYPDFPLTVRDEDAKVIGHLDPDYYFKAFHTIDDDVVDVNDGFESPVQQILMQGSTGAAPVGGQAAGAEAVEITSRGIRTRTPAGYGEEQEWWEANADQIRISSAIPGMTPLSNYQNPYKGQGGNPIEAYSHVLQDARFRDKGGRMVKAFPTYMLWLIDEGGTFNGVKLFDNFYGLQSVVDIAVGTSEDSMADTLVLSLSNLYSRLSSPYRNLIDESLYTNAHLINTQLNRTRNLASGLSDYLVTLDTVELKPGVRVHLRMGYSANPNALDTVFNGMITNVEQGEIVTVIAQSDTVELSAIVNNTNPEGNTGKTDGSMFGLWISEPRDLMIRLLSMGASNTKEAIAHATRGRIFSENRWGIRHFGTMLYPAMTETERTLNLLRGQTIDSGMNGIMGGNFADSLGGPSGIFQFGLFDVFSSFSTSFFKKRDYEIFKRNIYPGNGTGLSQYMGGDLGDGGVAIGLANSTGVGIDGTIIDPSTGQPTLPRSASDIVGAPAQGQAPVQLGDQQSPVAQLAQLGFSGLGSVAGVHATVHPFLQALGIAQNNEDDDIPGADEVSFRASTYMRSIWDLFQTCAALLPNYIVAVRPFEDRSTIFYGKPHWLYTSAVIPLTTGVDPSILGFEDPDEEFLSLMDQARTALAEEEEADQEFYDRLSTTVSADPHASTAGMVWDGRDVTTLPLKAPGIHGGPEEAIIPFRKTGVGMEMHLPTKAEGVPAASDGHQQLSLPTEYAYPYYMDRVGGLAGGQQGFSVENQDQNLPGKGGAFGILSPEIEQWYCNCQWPYDPSSVYGDQTSSRAYNTGSGASMKSKKILIYNERTQKGCICSVGEWGPGGRVVDGGIGAGVSPDVAFTLDLTRGDQCYFGFVDDSTPYGPVIFSQTTPATINSPFDIWGNRDATSIPTNTTTPGLPDQASSGVADDILTSMRLLAQTSADEDIDMTALMSETNQSQFAYLYGWGVKGFPVNYSDNDAGVIDELGLNSTEVFAGQKSDEEADTVWNEFRMDFRSEDGTRGIFDQAFPGQTDDVYDQVVDEFVKFMWQHAYHRGWLVLTVDAQLSVPGLLTGDAAALGNFLSRAPGVLGVPGATLEGAAGLGAGAIDVITGAPGDLIDLNNPLNDSGNHYDFHNARRVFEIWVYDPDQAKTFMVENATPGRDNAGVFGRSVEEFYTRVWSNVGDVFSSITGAIGAATSGILGLMRFSLMSMGQGIQQSTFQQSIANMMNRAFNDSMYFQAGPPGSLAFLADNPFTREYGEPVVEVRQPFQRVHVVNSFRNIIDNKVQENLDGVATVITATSGGKNPVTVHLDKGLPSEKQVERSVETGLKWDKPGGIPVVRNLIHPVETMRNWASNFNNGDDETSAKRVALWHLKEGLKDIYGGELIILGDPGIRPFDLVYLGDVYTRMYGLFEVEQVVHHFNADMGFVTSITPNAIVTINDPARWSMLSYVRARLNTWNLRNDLRHTYNSASGKNLSLPAEMTVDQLGRTFEAQLMGSMEYTGGNTAVVRDLAAAGFTNQLGNGQFGADPNIGPESGSLGGAIMGGMGDWSAWNLVRQRLLDQHGCYIQYLTKDGRPMDASLHDNRGIAVGQQRASTIFKNSLRIELPYTDTNGNSRIATNDLLAQLGWSPYQIDDLVQDLDLETNLVKAEIMDIAGRTDDGTVGGEVDTYWVTVITVIDGDTFDISPAINGYTRIRVAGVDSAEVAHKGDLEQAEEFTPDDPGVRAWRYTTDRLLGKQVAIRVNRNEPIDNRESRVLGYVFEYTPDEDMPAVERQAVLMGLAGDFPLVSWDSYWPTGIPRTFNWELVIRGHANVYLYLHDQILADQGVEGPIIGGRPND